MLESSDILESTFTNENKNLLEIMNNINTLAVIGFNNKNKNVNEKNNLFKSITDITTEVIKELRTVMREDLENKLNKSRTILKNLPNTEKEIENISSVIICNHQRLAMTDK